MGAKRPRDHYRHRRRPTGALIPASRVVLTNVETGEPVGNRNHCDRQLYAARSARRHLKLSVEHPGFSKAEMTNVVVQVAVATRVDVVLQVGSATQSVEVNAESTLLKTESGEQ